MSGFEKYFYLSFYAEIPFYFRVLSCVLVTLALLAGGVSSAHAQMLTGFHDEEVYQTVENEKPDENVYVEPEWVTEQKDGAEQKPFVPAFPELITPKNISSQSGQGRLLTYDGSPTLQNEGVSEEDEPVDLQADQLSHDEANQVITASGDVILTQSGRILRADEISYDLKADNVVARGHVVLNEVNGDIHYSEEVTFNQKLKNGFVKGLKSYLNDGSRFTAEEGVREGGVKTTMMDASYTPCEPCKANPEKAPVWQIVASEVVHDQEAHRVSYKNARFEVHGVPVAWAPYFSHPDGTIKRKSGFLSPSAGYKSDLGAFVTTRYYWNIAPDKDATFGLMAMTDEAPLGLVEWRQRWENASLELKGGVTYSGRIDRDAGVETRQEDEVRGHIFGAGRWDINDKWRAGLNAEWASDDQYMRQYDFSSDDILENEIYAERFSGRNYAVGRLLTFQDIRVREAQEDQPEVLPEIIASFVGEPGSVPIIGGRWSFDTSFLGLQRGGDDPDMNRMSFDVGWQRRFISDYGLLTTADASVRTDFYHARDRAVSTPGSGIDSTSGETRVFPQLHIQSSYPVAKPYENMQAKIEPIVALTLAPNIDVSDDIPNEDSRDVQIDASNLFEADRFPGLDRVEDKSRVTYGMRTGLYGYDGSRGDIFLGQSYRLDDDDNPFPVGSGLDMQESDVVGQITGAYKNQYSLNYRFQLDSRNLSSQRHEIDAYADWDRFRLNTNYLFAKALGGTDIDESREQLRAGAAYYLNREWRLNTGATQDLGQTPGLRKAHIGLDYFGQCISWSLTGERNLTDDASGESDTEILFRVGLKNLGGFEASGLRAGRPGE